MVWHRENPDHIKEEMYIIQMSEPNAIIPINSTKGAGIYEP